MSNTTEKLVKLLEPYLPNDRPFEEFGAGIDICTFNQIIWLLTHTSEGKPVKDGDVPCVLGGESKELKEIKGRIKVYSCKSFLEDPENEFFDYEIARFKDFVINRDEYYKARAEARYAPKTKVQSFFSYKNLTLATSDFEAFELKFYNEVKKWIEELEKDK